MTDDTLEITVAAACEKYVLPQKRLLGAVAQLNDDSPVVVKTAKTPGELVIIDDWRVAKLLSTASDRHGQ